jgi:hypothetical protein
VVVFKIPQFRYHNSVTPYPAPIVGELVRMEGRPWPEYYQGKPLSAQQMARLLKRYEIKPTTMRIGEDTAKGYKRHQFEDAWKRYLRSPRPEYLPPEP